jgi:hypothetical protein
MSQHGVEQAIGRAMLDPKFRKKFLEDPEGAAKAEGLSVSGSEAEKIKAAKHHLESAGSELGSKLAGPGAAAFVDIHKGAAASSRE